MGCIVTGVLLPMYQNTMEYKSGSLVLTRWIHEFKDSMAIYRTLHKGMCMAQAPQSTNSR